MNIVIVAGIPFPEGMASTACVTLMAKGVKANGVNSLLAIPSQNYNGKMPEKVFKDCHNVIDYKFFNKYPSSSNRFSINSLRNIKDLAFFLKMRKKQGEKDVVLLYDNQLLKYFPLVHSCLRYKIALFPWEVEKRISGIKKRQIRPILQYIGYWLGEVIIFKVATGMIVISSQLKEYFSKNIDHKKIHISPIMVEKALTSSFLERNNTIKQKIDKIKESFRIIVYSGSFGEKDGFPYILEAFKQFTESTTHQVILVTTGKTGKYISMDTIQKRVDDYGLKKKFCYLGLVTREELNYVNQNADILLVCRSNSEFAKHGFPWKLGEYLMSKKPIIATKVGDIDNYFSNKHLFLSEAEDSKSIAKNMINIFDNYTIALKNAGLAYEHAIELFDYTKVAKENIEFIKKLLQYNI